MCRVTDPECQFHLESVCKTLELLILATLPPPWGHLHGLIKPIVSPPKLCGILIHFIVPRGTPRKIWWECAARFLKPLTIYDENLQFFLPYLWFKGKVCIWAKWPIRLELIPVSIAWSNWEFFYSHPRLGGMLGPSQGYPPALSSLVPIYTPGWREALWE